MRAAVTLTLALCTALPAPAHCSRPHPENPTNCTKDSSRLYIYDEQDYKLYDSTTEIQDKVSIPYGTSMTVYCYGTLGWEQDLKRNGQLLPAKVDKLIIGIEDPLNQEHVYECTDVETGCRISKNVSVIPAIKVKSSTVQITSYNNSHTSYTVLYGEFVSVSCSGADAARLVMTREGETSPAARESDTSIKLVWTALDLQQTEYVCTDVNTTGNSSSTITVAPDFYFMSQNKTITAYAIFLDGYFGSDAPSYIFEYSVSIEVFCSGPRAVNLTAYEIENNASLLTENFNKSTAFISLVELGVWEFKCSDNENPDCVKSFVVAVLPRIEFLTPGVRSVGRRGIVYDYTIVNGQSLEVVCSGADASQLKLRSITDDIAQRVNETAVMLMVKQPRWNDLEYVHCSYSEFRPKNKFRIAILPTVTNFSCISYDASYVNCTWTAMNNHVNSTWFYTENGVVTRICDKSALLSGKYRFCVWESQSVIRNTKVFVFTMQSCSDVGCYNQTVHIDHSSVAKLTPPESLTVVRMTSLSAVLRWYEPRLYYADEVSSIFEHHHKVQYWYPGIEPRVVNSSLVTCDPYYYFCYVELKLPCPGQTYEAQVYRKLKSAAGEQFWSDPSVVTFTTEEGNNTDILDASCELKSIKTKDVMRYFVQELRRDVRRDIKLMKKVRSLQDKLANIRKLFPTA